MAETITTISPITNKGIIERKGLSDAELKDLVTRSAEAFNSYKKTSLDQRKTYIKKALDTISSKQDELAKEITEQMGRPISYTSKEITTALLRANYMLRISSTALADTPGDDEKGFKRYIQRLPIGVVLVIFAWNYPYLILVNSLIPAILAGDAAILKPSPQTPTIAEHMVAIFKEAGLPDGIIQYLHCGRPEDLRPLILSTPLLCHINCFSS